MSFTRGTRPVSVKKGVFDQDPHPRVKRHVERLAKIEKRIAIRGKRFHHNKDLTCLAGEGKIHVNEGEEHNRRRAGERTKTDWGSALWTATVS